jgi:Ftsk gamma domain/Uncharacterised protein family UPF0547
MGLQDLLAVVLGVKTAEALEERRKGQADLVALEERVRQDRLGRGARIRAIEAENQPIQARFLLAASPIICAMEPRDVYPPDSPALKDGRKLRDPSPDDFLIYIAGLHAADLAQGDPDRYERAITGVTLVGKSFEVNTQWAGQLRSKYGSLFDQLVDVHLDEVSLGVGDNLRQIRTNLRLPPLARLPKEKVCPRCAETVKAAAAVCRFCGYEYPSVDLGTGSSVEEARASVDELAHEEADPLLPDAVAVIREHDRVSASLLQQRLKIGYARAARMIDQLKARGYIG